MFGTIARMRPKAGQETAVAEAVNSWWLEQSGKAEGVVCVHLYRAASAGELVMSVVFDTQEHYEANAQDPRQDTSLLRARVRLAASHAVTASVRAVDLMHSAVGTASIFRDNPLERHLRDIHVAAAHVMIGRMTYEAAGRVELGMGPDFPYF